MGEWYARTMSFDFAQGERGSDIASVSLVLSEVEARAVSDALDG